MYTTNPDAVKLLAAMMQLLIIGLALWVLYIVAYWRILRKAGEAGWKAIIPIYSNYMLYKICWPGWPFWSLIAAAIVYNIVAIVPIPAVGGVLMVVCLLYMVVLNALWCSKLARAFGCGTGFAVGLFLLNPIFTCILAFGKAQYQGIGGRN